jgi:hypothetical protein
MTENTQTNTSGGTNIRTNNYSGRGGRTGRGWWYDRGGGRNNDGGRGRGRGRGRGHPNDLTKKSSHAGAIQSGSLKGLIISSDGSRSTQYKILKDALPVYCAEQSFAGVGEIVRTQEDWDETLFYPVQPTDVEKATFAKKYRTLLCVNFVEDTSVNPPVNTSADVYGDKWVVFDEAVQKVVMGKYERKVREKEKQWHRCVEHKKLLIDAVWGQLDDATQAQMELVPDYLKHRKDGDVVEFLKSLRDICNGSDDGGLSYLPFKTVVALKSLHLFSTQDVTNVHHFKKELKVKYEATKAICGKFPFGTEPLVFAMVHLPGGGAGNTFDTYCNYSAANKAKWERIYDDLM